MNSLVEVKPEYIYVTIPAEYICVYHRILAMMADYGEEMLKDCKASCSDKNSGVIECFNMFNSAVAARKLGKTKLAETIIKYIKAKINQIYKGIDNSTSFVFPVDENGDIKAFVSCGELPKFEIDPADGELYAHKFDDGFDEHFELDKDDDYEEDPTNESFATEGLDVRLIPHYEVYENRIVACSDLYIKYDGESVNPKDCVIEYSFDGVEVASYLEVTDISTGNHEFSVTIIYNGITKIYSTNLYYNPEYFTYEV